MSLLRKIHSRNYLRRRVRVLALAASELIPDDATVLDVGCGDGLIDRHILDTRSDVEIHGCDVVAWPNPHIPVEVNNAAPRHVEDGAYDCVMLIDVLHHARSPSSLLDEAIRIARRALVIKDHLAEGFLARPTLRLMDKVGNESFGVYLPYSYYSGAEWRGLFASRGLQIESWSSDLPIYPWWADWIFGRSMHFICRLRVVK